MTNDQQVHVVSLTGGNFMDSFIECYFEPSQKDVIMDLNEGSIVTIQGMYKGISSIAGIRIDNCSIVK